MRLIDADLLKDHIYSLYRTQEQIPAMKVDEQLIMSTINEQTVIDAKSAMLDVNDELTLSSKKNVVNLEEIRTIIKLKVLSEQKKLFDDSFTDDNVLKAGVAFGIGTCLGIVVKALEELKVNDV